MGPVEGFTPRALVDAFSLVVTGGHGTELTELVEAAFDGVAFLVGLLSESDPKSVEMDVAIDAARAEVGHAAALVLGPGACPLEMLEIRIGGRS
jgi:hypothetical protein